MSFGKTWECDHMNYVSYVGQINIGVHGVAKGYPNHVVGGGILRENK